MVLLSIIEKHKINRLGGAVLFDIRYNLSARHMGCTSWSSSVVRRCLERLKEVETYRPAASSCDRGRDFTHNLAPDSLIFHDGREVLNI